jgi:hypothetical protein
MKIKIQTFLMALMTFGAIHHAAAQGTAFTYQGRLNDSGQCANGQFDLQFELYGSAAGGTPLYASTTITSDVLVTNGLFAVTLDFGPGVFTGTTYYLETDVRTNSPGAGLPYTALAPRLQILPVPYAVYAETAGSAANFSGSVGGNVQGSQDATVVVSVGGQTAANIGRGVIAANSATPSNAPNSIVERDSNGNFSASALTLSGGLNMPDPAVFYSGSNIFLIEEGSLYLGKNGGSAVINPLDTLHNTGFGDYALNNEATTGSGGGYNTAVGENALTANTSGNDNTAVGYNVLTSDNTGRDNTAIGANALTYNLTANFNTAIGAQALFLNSSGSGNTAAGFEALASEISGSKNTAVGTYAVSNATTDSELVAIGYGALMNDNAANQGTSSGYGENVAVGYESLQANSTGNGNTATGYKSLYANTTGNGNSANGNFALLANINGSDNTADGYGALLNSTAGSNNTAVGFQAMAVNVANSAFSYNVAIGAQAMQNGTDIGAVAIGCGALQNDGSLGLYQSLDTYSGGANTAVGYEAFTSFQSGTNNAALGQWAGAGIVAGSDNTALGGFALSRSTGGSNNIALGSEAGITLGTGNNNIYIGNPGNGNESGVIRIGNTNVQTACIIGGIYNGSLPNNGTAFPVYVDAGGHLGPNPNPSASVYFAGPVGIQTPPEVFPLCVGANCFCDGNNWLNSSDRNVKSGFEPVDAAAILAKVAAMPITRWHYTNDLASSHIGPMAQDFYSAFAIGRDDRHIADLDEGGVALAAIQGLNQKLNEREAEIAGQKEEISDLKARLDRMEQMIGKHE